MKFLPVIATACLSAVVLADNWLTLDGASPSIDPTTPATLANVLVVEAYFDKHRDQMPECARNCPIVAMTLGNCTPADADDCVCRNEYVQTIIFECVVKNCNGTDAQANYDVMATLYRDVVCPGRKSSNHKSELRNVYMVGIGLAIFTLVMRCSSRLIAGAQIGWDDYLLCACTLVFVAGSISGLVGVATGMIGQHIWYVETKNIQRGAELVWSQQILFFVVQNLIKISILLSYLRIFPSQAFRRVSYAAIAVLGVWTVAFTTLFIFQCRPVSGFWSNSLGGTCLDYRSLIIASCAMSIAFDCVIISLPVRSLRSLQMSRRRKLIVAGMFSCGSVACVTSIRRLYAAATFSYAPDADAEFHLADLIMWGAFEIGAAIICACLMTCRPILSRFAPRFFSPPPSHLLSPRPSNRRSPWSPAPPSWPSINNNSRRTEQAIELDNMDRNNQDNASQRVNDRTSHDEQTSSSYRNQGLGTENLASMRTFESFPSCTTLAASIPGSPPLTLSDGQDSRPSAANFEHGHEGEDETQPIVTRSETTTTTTTPSRFFAGTDWPLLDGIMVTTTTTSTSEAIKPEDLHNGRFVPTVTTRVWGNGAPEPGLEEAVKEEEQRLLGGVCGAEGAGAGKKGGKGGKGKGKKLVKSKK